jgi:methanogenic corrinoid protein MtbC1
MLKTIPIYKESSLLGIVPRPVSIYNILGISEISRVCKTSPSDNILKRSTPMSEKLTTLTNLLADLNEEPFLQLVAELLEANEDSINIVEACRAGMTTVGNRFAEQEYFVSDLLFSADMFNSAMNLIGPKLTVRKNGESQIRVVIGTVQGDIHNIGKDLVISMLRCSRFEVFDAGINVPSQVFVDKIRETGATVLGLSGLLTVAYPSMKATIEALAAAGLRDKVKVMIGGGMMDDFVCTQVGADGWGHDAVEAVKLAQSFTGGK